MGLPANIFNDLTEATVEGWVKWRRFDDSMRFFDFGDTDRTMVIGNAGGGGGPHLRFEFWDASGRSLVDLYVRDLLRADEWNHIAVATGPGGVRIYRNGVLVAQQEYSGSFAAIKNGDRNYLGRNNWKETFPTIQDLDGQMDEVRVWNVRRTEEQIRENMFRDLTGREAGLVTRRSF